MRSLMLAGGGIKAGYQAGCLQVLLDEERIAFDHIDAASAGCFNAAMICSGKSGSEIAAAWANLDPLHIVSLNFPEVLKLFYARSFGTQNALRKKAFVDWGIDFQRINAWQGPPVTFNYFDFTAKELITIDHTRLDEDLLCACVALPIWFPPIERNGSVLVDAVFATDGNLDEALRRGASEIWAIWSVGKETRYRDGYVAQYFHMLEQAADNRFFSQWNALPSSITKHLFRQEVPIHYLANFSRDRMRAAVELGISDTRVRRNLPTSPPPGRPVTNPVANVKFTETLRGFYFVRINGRFLIQKLVATFTIDTGDIDAFVRSPDRSCQIQGFIDSPELGKRRPITTGRFELFVDERSSDGVIVPGNKRIRYSVRFRSSNGTPFELVGTKYVVEAPAKQLWRDTTTLYVRLYALSATPGSPASGRPYGAGILTISVFDFVRQLLSFRAPSASGPFAKLHAILRFVFLFLRHCWDVYARDVLEYGPF